MPLRPRLSQRRRALIGVTLLLSLTAAPAIAASAAPDAPDLSQRLSQGNHALLIRHAEAPGIGDPAHFDVNDCATQRNLDATGRDQARALGEWLRSRGIEQAAVYSSPWCRCLDTARLLGLGPVSTAPALGSFFARPQEAAGQTRRLQDLLARPAKPGLARVMVTHHVNIEAYTGRVLRPGAMVLVHHDRNGRHLRHWLIER